MDRAFRTKKWATYHVNKKNVGFGTKPQEIDFYLFRYKADTIKKKLNGTKPQTLIHPWICEIV
jgi:hypothetical protein